MKKEEKSRLKELERSIGCKFKDRADLRRALTHKSFANEQKLAPSEHNERLEFLGDAVMELAVSHMLMERFPESPEGELSKLRAAIVNETQLADVAQKINLGDFLYLGKGEDQTGGRDKPSLLSDALEAVFGAIYLDRGFKKAFGVIEGIFEEVLDRAGGAGFVRDYKTRLQEVSQARFRSIPRYRLQKTTGPDHAKSFEVHLFIEDRLWGVGHGASKKAAEQEAACEALSRIESDEAGAG